MKNNKELIGKKVKVDFREETGIVQSYNEKGVVIKYPSLGFSEIINFKIVEVNLLEN